MRTEAIVAGAAVAAYLVLRRRQPTGSEGETSVPTDPTTGQPLEPVRTNPPLQWYLDPAGNRVYFGPI